MEIVHRRLPTYRIVSLYLMIGVVCGLFSACTKNRDTTMPTYEVKRMDYEDVLKIEGYTEPFNSLSINCPSDVDGTIVEVVETGSKVKQGDVLCVIEDVNIANNYERWTLNLESMYAELEKLKASQKLEFALLEAQLQNNEVETILAESDSLQMLYMSPKERRIKELQLQRAQIQRDQLVRKVKITKELHKADVLKIERQIAQMERRLEEERKKIESLTIKAPKEGLVMRARRHHWADSKWNIGDNVWNGRTILMMPDMNKMKVIIHAQETEYKRMNQGDSIVYTFDAMPDNIGWGRITKLSPVGIARTEGSQVKTFEIEASVDSLKNTIDPGLSVQCKIFLCHVSDTIVVPSICVYEKDSSKVVYVRRDGRFEERMITIGESSMQNTVITTGLVPGEHVALVKPQKK